MGSSTRLGFGFPIERDRFAFTRVTGKSRSLGEGMPVEQGWFETFGLSQGIAIVPAPTKAEWAACGATVQQPGSDASREAWEAYWQQIKAAMSALEAPRKKYEAAVDAALANFGNCKVVTAGAEDDDRFFVVASYPELLRVEGNPAYRLLPSLEVAPELRHNLRRFCDAMGIEYQEPQWMVLESWWMD